MFEDLASRMSFAKKDVVSTVGSLLAQSLIKKEKVTVEFEPEQDSELKVIANLLDKTMIKKRITHYRITQRGIDRLAFWEYKFGLWEKVPMPWDISYDDGYFEEINRRVETHNHYEKKYN